VGVFVGVRVAVGVAVAWPDTLNWKRGSGPSTLAGPEAGRLALPTSSWLGAASTGATNAVKPILVEISARIRATEKARPHVALRSVKAYLLWDSS